VSGTLGGRRFDVSLAKVKLARTTERATSMTDLPLSLHFAEPALARLG
jgi:hypothetical protein